MKTANATLLYFAILSPLDAIANASDDMWSSLLWPVGSSIEFYIHISPMRSAYLSDESCGTVTPPDFKASTLKTILSVSHD